MNPVNILTPYPFKIGLISGEDYKLFCVLSLMLEAKFHTHTKQWVKLILYILIFTDRPMR
jgi:hypothetical protein